MAKMPYTVKAYNNEGVRTHGEEFTSKTKALKRARDLVLNDPAGSTYSVVEEPGERWYMVVARFIKRNGKVSKIVP
mgnify:CR=1 FL=1